MAASPFSPAARHGGLRSLTVMVTVALAVVVLAPTAAIHAAGPDPRGVAPAARPSRDPRATAARSPERSRAAEASRRRDAAVQPAGGASGGMKASGGGVVQAGAIVATADCSHCGRRGCNQCRPAGGRLGLPCNGKCDAGGCPAHCPVRPDQFGYYATRWRSWPGQGVQQVAHFDPATTPVRPPRSQIPTMDEESGMEDDAPDADEEAEDTPEANTAPASQGTEKRADTEAAAGDAGRDPSGLPAAMGTEDAAAPEPAVNRVEEPAPAGNKGAVDGRGAPADDPLERLLDTPAPSGGAGDATGDRPPAAFIESNWRANPLRAGREDRLTAPDAGGETHVATAIVGAEGAADRRPASKAGWRSLQRAPVREGETTGSLRGVTAKPGNPLR